MDELRADRDALAQAMWDARGILGFDNDGDKTPGAVIAGHTDPTTGLVRQLRGKDRARSPHEAFALSFIADAKQQRDDYEEVMDLWDGTERKEWAARAESAEAKVAAVIALCDSVPNSQTPLWPSQIRLAIEEAAQMGSSTDAADMTGPYAVGNDQQGETL